MNKTFILICLMGLSLSSFGQKIYSEKLINCPLKFILEDEQKYIYYKTGDSILWVDFISDFDEKEKEKFIGAVSFQVMVDTAQNPCIVSYTNKTNVSDRKMDILNRVQKMPAWRRDAEGMENINICALVTLYYDKYEVTVKRTGYNRNTGKRVMESTVYNRYKKSKIKEMKKKDKK